MIRVQGNRRKLRLAAVLAALLALLETPASADVFFGMPVSGDLYVEAMGGGAGGTSSFGLGTSPTDFVPLITGLPNLPNPTGEVLAGFFSVGTSINFGIYTSFGGNGWAFSNGTDKAAIESFTDRNNSLGLGGSVIQTTGTYAWLLHLDDALSSDDDDDDLLIQLRIQPVTAVPDPSAVPLHPLPLLGQMLLLGLGGFGFLAYRRKSP
jgi:hypothetical protein